MFTCLPLNIKAWQMAYETDFVNILILGLHKLKTLFEYQALCDTYPNYEKASNK